MSKVFLNETSPPLLEEELDEEELLDEELDEET